MNASVRNPDVHSSSLPRRTSSPVPPSPTLLPLPDTPRAPRGGLVTPLGTCHIPAGGELCVLTQGRAKLGCPALDFQQRKCWPYNDMLTTAMGTPVRPQLQGQGDPGIHQGAIGTGAAGAGPERNAHPKRMMPCPTPVFLGGLYCSEDIVSHSAGSKRAPQVGCNPKMGILQGRDTGDTQGPFPGGRLDDGRKPHHAWGHTVASRDVPGCLGHGMEEPVPFWHLPLP